MTPKNKVYAILLNFDRMSEQQLDTRRRGLEMYLERVCAIRVIAESDLMQEFLTESEEEIVRRSPRPAARPKTRNRTHSLILLQGNSPLVDLKVLLPTREVATVRVRRNSTCQEVFRLVASQVGLKMESLEFFALYEIVEHNFGEWPSKVFRPARTAKDV